MGPIAETLAVAAPYVALLATGLAAVAARTASKVITRIEVLEAKVHAHETQFAVMTERRIRLDGEFTRINERLDRADETMGRMFVKLDEIHKHLDEQIHDLARGELLDRLGGPKGRGS